MGVEGKAILLTRAAGQNDDLKKQLEQLGASGVEVPTIEIVEPESWKPVDAAIKKLSDYDWVIFTSANAVDAFLDRKAGLSIGNHSRIAAVGTQTARRLDQRGLAVTLIPKRFNTAGILDAFPNDLSGVRMLLPRAEVADEALPETLRDRGAQVDVVTVYRTRTPSEGGVQLRELLKNRKIDCITFTSGSTVHNLIELLDVPNPRDLFRHPRIAVIGPVTRQAVLNAGLRVDIEASEATIADLVDAIRHYFRR